MPGFDRRGPNGAGPMSGGGRGLCNNATQGFRPFGGFGRGAGLGRRIRGNRGFRGGFGWGAPDGYSGYPEDAAGDLEILKAQADSIRETLDAISKKISEMETSSE